MADHIGVTRNNFYFYKSGRSVPRKSTLNKLAELLEVRLVWDGSDSVEIADKIELDTPNIELKESVMELEAVKLRAKEEFEHKNKLISYQEQEIKELREENKFLKDNPIPKEHFDKLTFDWKTTVDIKYGFTKVTRRIYDLTNIENFANALETDKQTIEKYFDSKKTYEMNEHPVNKIISKQSLDYLQEETGFFMGMLKKGISIAKIFTSMGHMTLLIDYELNGKTCKTITYCQPTEIEPLKGRMKIINKVQFITE